MRARVHVRPHNATWATPIPPCNAPSCCQPPQLILQKAQPKRLGGFVLTGPVLAGLTEAYVAAINDGAVPTIATAWQVRRKGVRR